MRKLLRPTNDYAPDAILPGDPQVALELAQALICGPLMANHARGLWGYSGPDTSGRRLAIQSTGYGGQSAAAVADQLAGLGVRQAIRLGTCVAPAGGLAPGERLIVGAAIGEDGISRAPAAGLTSRLAAAHGGPIAEGTVASVDTVERADAVAPEAVAVDGASAGLFAAAEAVGIEVAAVLVVVEGEAGELGDEQARAVLGELGRVAARALSGRPQSVI